MMERAVTKISFLTQYKYTINIFFLNYINNLMFSDTEPEQEPNQPLFINFEERFGHFSQSNIGL